MSVIKNIKNECFKNNIDIVASIPRRKILNINNFDYDLVIINGEGSFHDNPNILTDLTHVLPKFKCKKVFINASWFNIDKKRGKRLLDMMDLVTVREYLSYNEIKIIRPDAKLIPDVIFLTQFVKNDVGYGDSVITSIRTDFSKLDNNFPMNSQVFIPDEQCFLNWLNTLRVHITGRFHGVCLSAIAKTPFLSIESNCPKISGLLKDMGCEKCLIKSITHIDWSKEHGAEKCIDNAVRYSIKARELNRELFRSL
jgi:hypothetical protein